MYSLTVIVLAGMLLSGCGEISLLSSKHKHTHYHKDGKTCKGIKSLEQRVEALEKATLKEKADFSKTE